MFKKMSNIALLAISVLFSSGAYAVPEVIGEAVTVRHPGKLEWLIVLFLFNRSLSISAIWTGGFRDSHPRHHAPDQLHFLRVFQ